MFTVGPIQAITWHEDVTQHLGKTKNRQISSSYSALKHQETACECRHLSSEPQHRAQVVDASEKKTRSYVMCMAAFIQLEIIFSTKY